MASITSNVITTGLRGRLGDSLIFKTVRGKTFVSPPARIPDKRRETAAQRTTRVNFREASQWAQQIVQDPEQKAYYLRRAKALKLPNTYTAALTDYMRKVKVTQTSDNSTVTYTINKPGFTLTQVRVVTDEVTEAPAPNVAIQERGDRWFVRYTSNEENLPLLLLITDNSGKVTCFKTTP